MFWQTVIRQTQVDYKTSGYIPHTFHVYPKMFQKIYSWSSNYSTYFPFLSPKNPSQILVVTSFSCVVFHRWRVLYTYAQLQTKLNNNFEGRSTISSHNPMKVVHKVSNHHLLCDKVISCCDRLYTHWLHQLLTVGIDVYFNNQPIIQNLHHEFLPFPMASIYHDVS
jgi:hypothetical protein